MEKNSLRYLLPHLSHLAHELSSKNSDNREKMRHTKFSLEQLPYCLGAA